MDKSLEHGGGLRLHVGAVRQSARDAVPPPDVGSARASFQTSWQYSFLSVPANYNQATIHISQLLRPHLSACFTSPDLLGYEF